MSNVIGTTYLIIEAERYRYSSPDPVTGLKRVTKAKVVGVRQSRPKSLSLDQVVVKVTIQLPTAVFDPISPEALIVTLDMVQHEIVTEAVKEEQEV